MPPPPPLHRHPRSALEASATIKIISFLDAPFPVSSGGHSEILTVASIGPGNRWSAVCEEQEPHGVGVLGERARDIGVAGLILGGWISYFTNGYGFAYGNVKSVQVVLSTRDIVDTNPDENPDLF
ncbi:unnamed protein product [Tuber aestivum]|uniref:FAD linked oxidase N-terminal domain-containing protein n=1 Tax=Tuber aestivum TaxID=59557 RepID=A0A292Q712_9PEZI|nr:unnamed protein product [Tuber aestivum]